MVQNFNIPAKNKANEDVRRDKGFAKKELEKELRGGA